MYGIMHKDGASGKTGDSESEPVDVGRHSIGCEARWMVSTGGPPVNAIIIEARLDRIPLLGWHWRVLRIVGAAQIAEAIDSLAAAFALPVPMKTWSLTPSQGGALISSMYMNLFGGAGHQRRYRAAGDRRSFGRLRHSNDHRSSLAGGCDRLHRRPLAHNTCRAKERISLFLTNILGINFG